MHVTLIIASNSAPGVGANLVDLALHLHGDGRVVRRVGAEEARLTAVARVRGSVVRGRATDEG
jgi:hypothetical protein